MQGSIGRAQERLRKQKEMVHNSSSGRVYILSAAQSVPPSGIFPEVNIFTSPLAQ